MATMDYSKVPGEVTIANNGDKSVEINFFGYNQSVTVPSGDTLIVRADTTPELVSFVDQATDSVEVTVPTTRI